MNVVDKEDILEIVLGNVKQTRDEVTEEGEGKEASALSDGKTGKRKRGPGRPRGKRTEVKTGDIRKLLGERSDRGRKGRKKQRTEKKERLGEERDIDMDTDSGEESGNSFAEDDTMRKEPLLSSTWEKDGKGKEDVKESESRRGTGQREKEEREVEGKKAQGEMEDVSMKDVMLEILNRIKGLESKNDAIEKELVNKNKMVENNNKKIDEIHTVLEKERMEWDKDRKDITATLKRLEKTNEKTEKGVEEMKKKMGKVDEILKDDKKEREEERKRWREEMEDKEKEWEMRWKEYEKSMGDLEEKIKSNRSKRGEAEQKEDKDTLIAELNMMKRRVEMEERRRKKKNIIISGLMVEKKEDVENWMCGKFGVSAIPKEVWKVGKVKGRFGAVLESEAIKEEIMEKKKELKGSDIFIENDLTWEERKESFRRREIARAKKEGAGSEGEGSAGSRIFRSGWRRRPDKKEESGGNRRKEKEEMDMEIAVVEYCRNEEQRGGNNGILKET